MVVLARDDNGDPILDSPLAIPLLERAWMQMLPNRNQMGGN
jgi:hypothetical protein